MMNDSVREELEIKATPLLPPPVRARRDTAPPALLRQNPARSEIKAAIRAEIKTEIRPAAPPRPALAKPSPAAETSAKLPAPTAPTLVEFQNRNATLPDWRLKMQNAARQRLENHQPGDPKEAVPPTLYKAQPATSGANALKTEVYEAAEAAEPVVHKNAHVANALKRIERSRKAFFVEEETLAEPGPAREDGRQNKNYPFYIAARTAEAAVKTPETKASINVPPKPKLVPSAIKTAGRAFDTNKLPPLPAKVEAAFEKPQQHTAVVAEQEVNEARMAEAAVIPVEEEKVKEQFAEFEAREAEEIEDLAPFAMRFNAGFFDLLIGAGGSLLLLAPFILAGGNWFSFVGFLAFLATCSVIMFSYLTISVGLVGRTLGMRLFGLELIDVEENDYPTFHQAAVSSCVYLLSLALGGIGFLTVPFNEEKRAVHDLVSGTVVVREE